MATTQRDTSTCCCALAGGVVNGAGEVEEEVERILASIDGGDGIQGPS